VEPPLTIRRFKNRKGAHTLNVLVTAGFDHRIYDVVVNAPGSFHDAAIWRISEIKQYLEMRFPRRYILGDSAFPITDNLIIPYTRRQAAEDVERALFNHRQSKARVEMTEDTCGIW